MTKRYQVPEGQKTLPDRILELLERGPVTTLDLYREFKEYKTNSIPSALFELRARGHKINKKVVGVTKRGLAIIEYSKSSK